MRQTAVRLLCCLFYIVLLVGVFNATLPEPLTAPISERLVFYTAHYFAPWGFWLLICESIYRIYRRLRKPSIDKQ